MPLYAKVPGPIKLVNVGNGPTINNGIATDFTSANYLKTNKVFATGNNTWEAVFYASTPDISVRQNVMSYTTGNGASVQVGIVTSGNPVVFIYIRDKNGSQPAYPKNSTRTVEANKWYYFRVQFTGTNYFVDLSEDGETWNRYIDVTHSVPINQLTYLSVGWNGGSASEYWRGSIDLNKSYIKIGDSMWYGIGLSRVKVRSGLAKYSVVGNPTIENGILSNSGMNNYVCTNTNYNVTNNDSWEWVCKVKFTELPTSSYYNHIMMMGPIGVSSISITYGSSAGGCYPVSFIYVKEQPSGAYINNSIPSYVLSPNIWYYFKTEFKYPYFTTSVSMDGVNWTSKQCNINGKTLRIDTNYPIYFGRGRDESMNTLIDLSSSYIKINGSYFWRGSDYYQNLDSYKVHQDTFSKYYTIVDGKLTWANPNIYLENTSLSKIDTGISSTDYPSLDFTLKTSVTTLGTSTSQTPVIFGSNTGDVGYIGYRVDDSKYLCGGGYRNFGTKITDINYLTGTISNYGTELSLTDNNITITCSGGSSSNYNYNLFCTGTENPADYRYAKARIYSGMTMSVNGVKLRHFVPVPKGLLIGNFVVPSNGMFDIVTQTFYGNAGTGEFEIGGIPNDYIIEGGEMIWCNPDISLESTGTQYIDTGIKSNSDLEVSVKWYQVSGQVFGNIETSSGVNKSFGLDSTSAGGYFRVGTGYYTGGSDTYAIPGWHTVIGNKNTFIRDGKTNTLSGSTFSDSTNTITLFRYRGGSSYLTGKVAYFGISKSGFQLQYLVPVPKGILIGDKIAPSNCMFDLVTQTFFENQGTGEFTISGLSGNYIFIGDDVVWCNSDIYLQCNGAQYFDSGFKANQDTKIRVEYTHTQSGVQTVYCCRDGLRVNTTTLFSPVSGTTGTRFDYNTSQTELGLNPTVNARRVILADKNKCYIDGVLKYTATYAKFQSNNTMIFGCSNGNGYANWSYFKYHNIQLYDDDHLIRYFIPVTTNMQISGTTIPAPGMWDIVTKKYFGNKGTESFTYGGTNTDYQVKGNKIWWVNPSHYITSYGTYSSDTSVRGASQVHTGIKAEDTGYLRIYTRMNGGEANSFVTTDSASPFNQYIYRNDNGKHINLSVSNGGVGYNNEIPNVGNAISYTDAIAALNKPGYISFECFFEGGQQYTNWYAGDVKIGYRYSTSYYTGEWVLNGSKTNSSDSGYWKYGNTSLIAAVFKNKQCKLSRYFVPVKSGWVAGNYTIPSDGLYDLVEGKFYQSDSTHLMTFH